MTKKKLLVGWEEWCQLPDLHLPAIKAKIDTGAKTSALHAVNIQEVTHDGSKWLHFSVLPLQNTSEIIIDCQAPLIDNRYIINSGGQKERRYIIKTTLQLGTISREIELSLANRDALSFRLLLGREAIKGNVIIDPAKLCCQGKLKKSNLLRLYKP